MPTISLILLHHNKAAYSRACLHSLLRSTHRPLQIINVDNGSQDETARVLDEWETAAREHDVQTARLNFSTNIGAVAGRNAALEIAEGEFFGFLDNDMLMAQNDWMERLLEFLAAPENQKCGIVAPKLLFPWSPFAIECCGVGVSKQGRIRYIGRGESSENWKQPFAVQCLISAAWLMRRELVEEIGVLDEIYSPVQYEDLDFCYRARRAGWECFVQPQAQIYHFEHTTTAGSGDINFKYVTTKNGITFKKRWAEMFRNEDGPDEAQTAWQELPKHSIEEINWRAIGLETLGEKL